MKFRVHNTQEYLSSEARHHLESFDCQVSHGSWDGFSEEDICREIRDLDAVIAGGEGYTSKVLRSADRLKIIARTGAGYDHVDVGAATKKGIWVTITPGATSPAVAEFTIGLIFSLLRNIHGLASDTKNGRWQRFRGRELGSLTVGVVGAGSIGREVIKRAVSLGAQVVACDVEPERDFSAQWQCEYTSLDDLLARSDVVCLHVPMNDSTRALISERKLRLMKETAYLVDTSRPSVVDRSALLKALQAGAIAGAALDVHDPMPCAPDDPLLRLDNVLATPWTAFNTEEAVARMSIMAARDVVSVLQGKPPLHPVNHLPEARGVVVGAGQDGES